MPGRRLRIQAGFFATIDESLGNLSVNSKNQIDGVAPKA